MRPLSAIFIISAVVFIAVFGVFFMLHVEGEGHVDCPLGAADGASCKNITNPFASIEFHMKTLLQPAVVPVFSGILALAAFFVLALTLALLPDAGVLGLPLLVAFTRTISNGSTAIRKLRAWLVIHEKRDPSSLAAVSA